MGKKKEGEQEEGGGGGEKGESAMLGCPLFPTKLSWRRYLLTKQLGRSLGMRLMGICIELVS